MVEPLAPPHPLGQRPWAPPVQAPPPPAQSWAPPPAKPVMPPVQPSTPPGMQPTTLWPPHTARQAAKSRRVPRWSIVLGSIIVALAVAGFFVVRQMWIGYAPGVYVIQAVEKRQRVTADLLKEIGPPPDSDPEAPRTIKELGDGTSFFCNALGKRQRIRWSDVATDASQCAQ